MAELRQRLKRLSHYSATNFNTKLMNFVHNSVTMLSIIRADATLVSAANVSGFVIL